MAWGAPPLGNRPPGLPASTSQGRKGGRAGAALYRGALPQGEGATPAYQPAPKSCWMRVGCVWVRVA
eukprot:15794349-Heterocapsa_arctica.AAC.1